jgi:hypothetical protein
MAQGYQAGAASSIYRIDRTGFDQDVAHILRQFDRIGQRARQPLPAPRLPTASGAPAGGGGGGSPRTAPDQSAQLQRQADAALRLAQAQARLAQAEGDTTRATAILNTALAANTNASERASLAVQTQAARIQHGTTYFQQFGQSASSSLLSIVGPAAAAVAAIGLLKAGFDSIGQSLKFKADLDSTTAGINSQLRGVRDITQTWNQAQAFATRYKLTQAELNATLQASTQTLRTTKSSVNDVLTTLSLLQTKDTSKPISEAARALRELESGDTTSIKELFNIPARDANKMKDEIQGGADAVQVLRRYLEASGATLDSLQAKTTGLAGALRDVAIAEEQVKLAEAQLAAGPGLTTLDIKARALTGLSRVLSGDLSQAGQSITGTFQAATAQSEVYRATLERTGSQTTAFIAAWNAMVQAQNQIPPAVQASSSALDGASAAAANHAQNQIADANAAQQHAAAMLDDRAAVIASYQASLQNAEGHLASGQALEQDAAQAQLNAVQAELLGLKKQELAAQAQRAAQLLLQSGQAGAVTASKLANSSSLVDVLTAAYYRLAQAQQAAGGGVTKADGVQQHTNRLEAQANAYKKIRDAQEQQALSTGTVAQQQAVLNGRLERARVTYGAQSEEFIKAETALIQFQQQQDKAASKGSKAGGGGVKLTDQERLNNKLLANEDAYQNKTEDEARRHAENLLKIERDFQTRSLEQQRLNETGKRASRFEFYRSLTQAGKDLGEGEAQAYSAAYEQAFAESQQLAQDGQHKLAADRLALRRQQIQEDIEAAKAIRAAEEQGDREQAESLRALEALRKDSQAEELKQLEARGDQLVNDRAKAIADEQSRFDQANAQNEQSATRKADSVVTAAEREKKAIGDVNGLLAKQNDLYARSPARPTAIGEAVSTNIPASSAPAAPAAAPASSPASAGAAAATLMAVFDAAVVGAIEAQTATLGGKLDTIVSRLDNVERAVRSSRPGSVT